MIVKTFILSLFEQNTRVVACEKTGTAMCVDPGAESTEIVEFINHFAYDLQAIALTHAHLDHIGGVTYLHRHFPEAEIILHKDDEDLYYGLPDQPLFMGVAPDQLKTLGLEYETPPPLTRHWQDNEIYKLGNLIFNVFHCPGHAPGHVIFSEKAERTVLVGDCLFAGSIGRTDLPGGNFEQLINSINTKILPLGDDFAVLNGHGSDTTIGREKATNPFLQR